MTYRTSIYAAGNTYNPCLLVLQEKGYRLECDAENDRSTFYAFKDNCRFIGDTPAELLGIVMMWERYGESWQSQTLDILTQIVENPAEDE